MIHPAIMFMRVNQTITFGFLGRSEGGTLLQTVHLEDGTGTIKACPVKGSLADATKLAGSDGMCGIIWGINGTCHSAANRLLCFPLLAFQLDDSIFVGV